MEVGTSEMPTLWCEIKYELEFSYDHKYTFIYSICRMTSSQCCPTPSTLHINSCDRTEKVHNELRKSQNFTNWPPVFAASAGKFSAVGLHVVGVVARWSGDVISPNAADSIAVVAWRLTTGKRFDQKQLLSAEPIDGVLRVVIDQVIERMKQLRPNAVRARTVGNDAEMLVPMRRFHCQCIITNLAQGRELAQESYSIQASQQTCTFMPFNGGCML